jgi:hypothetical protein
MHDTNPKIVDAVNRASLLVRSAALAAHEIMARKCRVRHLTTSAQHYFNLGLFETSL